MKTFLVTDLTTGATIAFSALDAALQQASLLVSLGHETKVEETNVSDDKGGK